jgi:hypothetical protein
MIAVPINQSLRVAVGMFRSIGISHKRPVDFEVHKQKQQKPTITKGKLANIPVNILHQTVIENPNHDKP